MERPKDTFHLPLYVLPKIPMIHQLAHAAASAIKDTKLESPAAVVMEKLANTSEEVGTSLQTG